MKQLFLFLFLVVAAGSTLAQSRKSVSILGDSYSTFEGYLQPDTNAIWYFDRTDDPKRTDVASVAQTWWHQFIRESGYKLCVNNSFSGATISFTGYKDQQGKHRDFTSRSFITRLNNLGDPDILLIFGGTNDSWAGAPIGEYQYADWKQEDLFKFRPALAYLLQKAQLRYPNVEIYFILNSELSEAVNESVRTICAHYGVPCIELENIEKKSGHPSVAGMKAISDQVKRRVHPAGE